MALQPVHGGIQREREKQRHEDPDQDMPRQKGDLDERCDRKDDPEYGQDRACAEAYEAFRDHVRERIAKAPDV